jgi:hypothetical protein
MAFRGRSSFGNASSKHGKTRSALSAAESACERWSCSALRVTLAAAARPVKLAAPALRVTLAAPARPAALAASFASPSR